MNIHSVEMSLILACSWRQAEKPPETRSRIGAVGGKLTSGEAWKPDVNLKKKSCGVVLRQRLSAEKPQQTLLSSRDCYSDSSL